MNLQNGAIIEKIKLELPTVNNNIYSYDKEIQKYMKKVEPFAITYMSDGIKIRGFYIKPIGKGPFPCIIYNRGGNREFGSITEHTIIDILCRFASWGYIVIASQYRGSCGSEGKDEFGGSDINDVLNIFNLIDNDKAADHLRIGMYGGSRGGMMTYMALSKTDRVKAAVIRCGVSDLTSWTDERKDMEEVYTDLIPNFSTNRNNELIKRSAIYWAEKLCKKTPILIMQGTADWRVNPLSALFMAKKLLELHHPFRLIMLEGADHSLKECKKEWERQTREWFDRFIINNEQLPNMDLHGD
jgi:dipeptidyl aminopeptidase/acylaminoacyl peptidase